MPGDVIKLNFINQTADTNNSTYVVFQQNVAESFGEIAIAWQTIENCGRGDRHPFDYPTQFMVAAGDSYGNLTPEMPANIGEVYEMKLDHSGDVLVKSSETASSPSEVEIRNNLTMGSIDANIYRNGKLLASKTNVAPGQKGVFLFHPIIYIGATSQIQEGDVMDSAIIQSMNTQLDLTGINSADIIATGGGGGKGAKEFEFHLDNIK